MPPSSRVCAGLPPVLWDAEWVREHSVRFMLAPWTQHRTGQIICYRRGQMGCALDAYPLLSISDH